MAEIRDKNYPDMIKEYHARESVQHLDAAKVFVDKLSQTHETTTIKIRGGVIVTTNPDKWEEHCKALNKEMLR